MPFGSVLKEVKMEVCSSAVVKVYGALNSRETTFLVIFPLIGEMRIKWIFSY